MISSVTAKSSALPSTMEHRGVVARWKVGMENVPHFKKRVWRGACSMRSSVADVRRLKGGIWAELQDG